MELAAIPQPTQTSRGIRRVPVALMFIALLLAGLLSGQNITGVITGTVKDSAGAVIPGAHVTLRNQQTQALQITRTNDLGIFVFPSVLPGTYTLEVSAPGFRVHEIRDIGLTMNERRSLGEIVLEVGQVAERVEVRAEVTPVQTASGERAGLITTSQLMNTAIRGRDFFSLLSTLPGIYDENMQSRDVSKGPGAGGLHINGGRSTSINFSLDGVQNNDTGSNTSSPIQPAMDAVAEIKVLTSNYQAEYGRNSAGTINVITKSGTQEYHGSAYYYHRHEALNANAFFRNRTGTPRPVERIKNFGYTFGGPIPLGRFNRSRDKLFFFWSQEFVRRQNYPGVRFVTTPTAAQRKGDFSDTRDVNGALVPIRDPLSGQYFPGNIIPASRINRTGQAILEFFPLPNYQEPDPALRYSRNYRASASGAFPRHQELFRIDYNVSPTLHMYFRGASDDDIQNWPYGNWRAGSHNYDMYNTRATTDGAGAVLHVTKTFSPTLVNEFTFGASNRALRFNPTDPSLLARSRMGNIGQWYPHANESGAIPDVTFGGVPNAIDGGIGNIPYRNRNPVFTWVNNISKVVGSHALKFGIYLERMRKDEVGSANTRGALDFRRSTNNPFDTNWAFSNCLLGYFYSYSEANLRTYSHYRYTQVEFYAQDSWKAGRRLSLEFGVRFYWAPPAHDERQYLTTFLPDAYDAQRAAVMYRPGFDPATGRRAAIDPRTGAVAALPYIGLFVPGSGDYAPGMRIGGKGVPDGLYTAPFSAAPRFGFALDPKADGKTAIRGGFGVFYDRPQGNLYAATVGQPPVSYSPTVYFGHLDTFLQATGVVGPPNVFAIEAARQPLPATMNFSLGIQRHIGFGSVADVAYVGSLARHLIIQRNINSIPKYARFNPESLDFTTNRPLPDNFLRPYLGMGSVNYRTFDGTSNYHSLQVSINRRMSRGFQYGVAYTWSKSLGVAGQDFGNVSYYFPMRRWNYGPLSYDVNHMLVISYIWEVPALGKRLGNRLLGAIADRWQLAGITAVMSGLPFTPSFSTTDGEDITGSEEGARIVVTGNPELPRKERTFYRNFRTEVFARPPRLSFGNAGIGILRHPGWSNWDISVSKRIPVRGEETYFQLRAEFYNAWNHPQFNSYDTGARFDPAGRQVNANFGALNGTRDPRKIQLSLRLMF